MTFTPRLVALDIDGTLFANEPSTGLVEETVSPDVVAAVRRAYAAGAHVVLATGRSTFGITDVWDCLLYTSPSPRDPKTSRMPSSA